MEAFLFVVDSQGKVVSVTDNISKYLGYQPSDWSDRSIYNFLNVANHAAFGKNLLSLVGGIFIVFYKQTGRKLIGCKLAGVLERMFGGDNSFMPFPISTVIELCD